MLIDLEQFGAERGREWTPDSNLLVRGDNLLALEALRGHCAGRVKLVYIDPPFNTGTAFAEYDDRLGHSAWLEMIRPRLELVRELLADDGSIWAQIDDTELGRLNVLMDEVFGRENRIATVAVKRSAPSMQKAINPGPVNVTDFILGYARDRARWSYRPQLVLRDRYDPNYSKWIERVEADPGEWELEPLAEAYARRLGFEGAKPARRELGGDSFRASMRDFALRNGDKVARLATPNYRGVSAAARETIDRSKREEGVHRLQRADFPDLHYLGGQQILFLADKLVAAPDGTPSLAERLTNFWDDVPWQGISGEGGVRFPKNKKPEGLLRRVIALASDEGDLVLDCFAGSGTTGAVAHKMGRRWIMVEAGEHAETLARERLARVVAGEDRTGASKLEGWNGGGGFRYLAVAEPAGAERRLNSAPDIADTSR